MPRVIAVLEVAWGDSNRKQHCRSFVINPHNHSGKRLYWWLGHGDLRVTNACPQLVVNARGRGTPDPNWLGDNLRRLWPFELLLVCGKTAQQTYSLADTMVGTQRARVIELPHPANRTWTKAALERARWHIQEGMADLHMELVRGKLVVTKLIPF